MKPDLRNISILRKIVDFACAVWQKILLCFLEKMGNTFLNVNDAFMVMDVQTEGKVLWERKEKFRKELAPIRLIFV